MLSTSVNHLLAFLPEAEDLFPLVEPIKTNKLEVAEGKTRKSTGLNSYCKTISKTENTIIYESKSISIMKPTDLCNANYLKS